jgi:DNA-binding MarR family transcriptional regulator
VIGVVAVVSVVVLISLSFPKCCSYNTCISNYCRHNDIPAHPDILFDVEGRAAEELLGGQCCEALAQLGDDRITLVGLVFESALGLRRHLAPAMEDELGVGGQAFEILIRLGRTPGRAMRMASLAAETGLTPSGLTRALDRLVEAGLCTRESCASDRRGTYAQLTELGEARVGEAIERHRRDIDELLAGLFEPAEESTLLELLARLRDRVRPEAVPAEERVGEFALSDAPRAR